MTLCAETTIERPPAEQVEFGAAEGLAFELFDAVRLEEFPRAPEPASPLIPDVTPIESEEKGVVQLEVAGG